jgi:hypothetical protein
MPPRKGKAPATTKAEHSTSPEPTKVVGGNTKGDIAWLVEVADQIREVEPGEQPEGFLYDVKLQWMYPQEELNPDFWEAFRRGDKKRQCNGPAYVRDSRGGYVVDSDWVRLKRPCLSPPAKGADVCHRHGAQLGHVKRAAMNRLAEASEVAALRLIILTGTSDEIGAIVAHKDRIAALTQVLDRAGIKHGAEAEDPANTPGYKKILGKLFGADDEGGG